jgi:hypothetical protein
VLIDWVSLSNQPLRLNPYVTGFRRFVSVYLASLFTPGRLGRLLPPRVSAWDAFCYSVVVRCVAALIISAITVADPTTTLSTPDIGLLVLLTSLYVVLASLASDVFIAGTLAARAEPRQVAKQQRFRFWFALCCAFSSHLILSAASIPTCFVAAGMVWDDGQGDDLAVLFLIIGTTAPFLFGAWWWFCLGRAIFVRGVSSGAKWLIVALIPLLGAAGAYVASVFIGLVWHMVD